MMRVKYFTSHGSGVLIFIIAPFLRSPPHLLKSGVFGSLKISEYFCTMLNLFTDEFFMKEALKEARLALEKDEVPIGAVVVCQNRIIARAHNLTEQLTDVTAHAEMQAFTAASNFLGSKYLEGCTLFVTIEPCVMCAGAAFWTQISKIVFGAFDAKRGFTLTNPRILHPKTQMIGGVLETECSALMKTFFKGKRN